MNLDVICIGSAGFDIFISGKQLKPSRLLVEDSITLNNDSSYGIDHAVYEAGGSALNSSIVFARQGINTGCMARTGKDHLANQIKIIAKHEGIGVDTLISRPEHHTDMKIHIVTERSHEIGLSYYNSSNSLRAKDTKFSKLKAKLVYFSELPEDFKVYKYYASWAKINNVELAVSLNSLNTYKKRQISYVLSTASRVLIPYGVASGYFGKDESQIDLIRLINGFGAKSILMYDVVDKAYAFEDNTIYISNPYKKSNPLDMTGSEDVFSAAYTAAIFQNKSIPEALTLASANACSVMEIFGTRTGILKKPALRTMKVETNIL